MAIKNLSTLKIQFTNFINRISPFDGNKLVQKLEHDQVMQDQLDSAVWKTDGSLTIPTSASMVIDASLGDLFIINTNASGSSNFDVTVINIKSGQRVRVQLKKKSTDIIHIPFGKWWPTILSNGTIKQDGKTDLSFECWNILGAQRFSLLDPTIAGFSVDGGLSLKTKVIEIGDWNMDASQQVIIPHGIDNQKIRSVDVKIRIDSTFNSGPYQQGVFDLLIGTDIFGTVGGVQLTGSCIVALNDIYLNHNNSMFNSPVFSATGVNRGWITIVYED